MPRPTPSQALSQNAPPLPAKLSVRVPEELATGKTVIKPHPGPQTSFLLATADIVVFGGAAGPGKTWGLLLDAAKYAALKPVPGFDAVIFRRTNPRITMPGGLWAKSHEIYPYIPGAVPLQNPYRWLWPKHNTSISFYHLQHEETIYDWKGGELAYLGFDELTEFTEFQFWYLLSRNRSTSGVRPRVRATTNPDADSWVKVFLAPWVDERYPHPAESGEIRWFYRQDDALVWIVPGEGRFFRRSQNILTYWVAPGLRDEQAIEVKSCTFIAATLHDNPTLMEKDPGYIANLKSLQLVERRRLLDSDWSIRPSGNMFRRDWFQIIEPEHVPEMDVVYRAWDNAGTEEPTKANQQSSDPDYTASVKIGFSSATGCFYVLDVINQRLSPKGVTDTMYAVMRQDGVEVSQYEEQEGGWSGKGMIQHHRARFAQYDYHPVRPTTNKIVRAKPYSSATEGGLVYLVRAPWNDMYIGQLTVFPKEGVHDDMVDASSLCYSQLAKDVGIEQYMADREANGADEPNEDAVADTGIFTDSGNNLAEMLSGIHRAQRQRAAQAAQQETLDPFGFPIAPDVPSPMPTQEEHVTSLSNILNMLSRLRD